MNIYIYTHTYKRKRKICVYICIWHVVMRAHVSMFKYECRGHAGIPVSRLVMDDLLITGTDTFGWCRRVTLESTVLTSALHKAPIVSSALRESLLQMVLQSVLTVGLASSRATTLARASCAPTTPTPLQPAPSTLPASATPATTDQGIPHARYGFPHIIEARSIPDKSICRIEGHTARLILICTHAHTQVAPTGDAWD